MNLKIHTGYVKFGGENVCFWFWFKSGFIKIRKKDLRVLPKFFTFVSAKKWNKNLPEF